MGSLRHDFYVTNSPKYDVSHSYLSLLFKENLIEAITEHEEN